MAMLQEFKEFIMRGNIIDIAVAFILGVAFGAVGWGYAHPDSLRAAGPQEFFDTVQELGRFAMR